MSRFDAPVEERTLDNYLDEARGMIADPISQSFNYLDEARGMIGRWGQLWMLKNDDVIVEPSPSLDL